MKRKLAFAFALLALAPILPARADFYWLAVGISYNANNNASGGAGNYLILSNDDPSVTDFKPVKLFDVRRTENGGTKLRKVNNQNGTAPYEGCEYGGAHYDLTHPIKDAEGNEFTFVGFEDQAFKGNNYIGSIKLPDTMEYINYATFWQCRYLKDFQWPADVTKLTIGTRLFDTCERLVGPMELPAKFVDCGERMFCDCSRLIGFGGVSVTNVGANAFQNCSSLEAVEFGDGASVTFNGDVIFQNAFRSSATSPNNVRFRSAPLVVNKYILAFDPSTGNGVGNTVLDWWGSRSVVVYIPFNAAKDGPTVAWQAFAAEFTAAKDGNAVTFPSDNGDGTWADGSIYNKQVNKTVTVRFWDPDSTATAALMAY